MASRRSSIGILVATSAVWGSSWVANSMLREQCAPLHLAILRYGLGGLLLLAAHAGLRLARRPSVNQGPNAIRPNLLLAVTVFAAPNLLLLWADRHGPSGLSPLIYAAMPLGLTVATGKLRAPAIVAVGAVLVLLNGSFSLTAKKFLWALPIAAAVALQGWSLVYVRRHLAESSSLLGVGTQLLVASAILRIALRFWPQPASEPLTCWPAGSLAALAALALLGTAAAWLLYYRLLRHLDPSQAAVSQWLQTIVAVGESALLLEQWPGWIRLAAACTLIVCATLLLNNDPPETSLQLGLFD